MAPGNVVEKVVDGDTASLVFGAGGGSAVDDGLGGGFLHHLGLFIDLGLCGNAYRFAAGLAAVVDADGGTHEQARDQQPDT